MVFNIEEMVDSFTEMGNKLAVLFSAVIRTPIVPSEWREPCIHSQHTFTATTAPNRMGVWGTPFLEIIVGPTVGTNTYPVYMI